MELYVMYVGRPLGRILGYMYPRAVDPNCTSVNTYNHQEYCIHVLYIHRYQVCLVLGVFLALHSKTRQDLRAMLVVCIILLLGSRIQRLDPALGTVAPTICS